MAYRKTEKVLANIAEKRNRIFAAAMQITERDGIEAIGCDAVAGKARLSVGLIYHYYPDMSELRIAVIQQLLDADLIAMRERAEEEEDNPLLALVGAMAVFFTRFAVARVASGVSQNGTYDSGIRMEFSRLIAAATDMPALEAKLAARAGVGALYGLSHAYHGQEDKRLPAAILFILRGIGVPDREARRILVRAWGTDRAAAL